MTLTDSPPNATTAIRAQPPAKRPMSVRTPSARKTSAATETGTIRLLTAGPYGIQPESPWTGSPIATVAGPGLRPGDGPGSRLNPGALRPSTMVVGHASATAGDGRPDQGR